MALGEWISVQSSRELYEKQLQIEKEEIESEPDEEKEELALIYQARGLDESEARFLAEKIMSNKEGALKTHAREELGIDPSSLAGRLGLRRYRRSCLLPAEPSYPFSLSFFSGIQQPLS